MNEANEGRLGASPRRCAWRCSGNHVQVITIRSMEGFGGPALVRCSGLFSSKLVDKRLQEQNAAILEKAKFPFKVQLVHLHGS